MPLDPSIARRIDDAVTARVEALSLLSRRIHENPELRFEEHKAAAWISEACEKEGHTVEREIAGMSTAFRVKAEGGKKGARVAILAEYDALPEIGHACGHNLIATAATGAFLAIAGVMKDRPGVVLRLGTPAA